MSMMLLTALAAAVVMVTNTETLISANHRNSQEALYAADAAVERIVQDLLMTPRWNDVLLGSVQSSFIDGAMTSTRPCRPADPCCSTPTILENTATTQLQSDTDTLNLWGANNPRWKLFAWGPLSDVLSNSQIDSSIYVAVWVADDPADSVDGATPDGNPMNDSNGVLAPRRGARRRDEKVIEVTVARTSSTEIERGQIAQRGQEELNQRARKAAVQTPGKAITNTRMTVQ